MAYNNRRDYRDYDRRKIHLSKRTRNRAIIIATGLIIFALIITLISTIISCICTGSASTDPTVNTATIGTGKKAVKKAKTENVMFKEPEIKDSDSSSTGTFDNDYYIWNAKAFEAFNGTKSDAKAYAKFINKTKEALGLSVNVYSAIVPTHIEMGLPGRLKNTDEGIKTNSQADYIKAAYKNYSKKVKYINPYNLLSQRCNDYIYFDSDHNPTGLGGYYIYKAFTEGINKKAIDLKSCKESTVENFYGSYNNFTDTELNVDTVHYWDFSYDINNTITTSDGETDTTYSCYNKEVETGASAYNVFLYGKNPLEVIRSESDKADGKIAIVHGNFGNPVVPYFTYNYEEVYSIDYTTYEGNLKNLCAENDIKNVLFISDAVNSADAEQLAALKKLTGVK